MNQRRFFTQDTAGKPTVLPASLAVPWLKVNGALVRETPLLSQVYTKNDQFTKIGSGQRLGKLRKQRRFLQGMPMVLTAMLDLWNWRRPQGAAFSPAGKKTPFVRHLIDQLQNDHFTKTGSGRTPGKLTIRVAFSCRDGVHLYS